MADDLTPHGVMEKIEFYFLGLTFTLLALAVQTFKPSTSLTADVVETGGWLLLLISGLVGVSKIEWIPVILLVKNRESFLEDAHRGLEKAEKRGMPVMDSQSGQPVNVPELMATTGRSLNEIKSHGLRLGKGHELRHDLQRVCFVLGLVALLLARAQGVIQRVMDRII